MRFIKFLLANLLMVLSVHGATVSYNTANGMLLQPTNFFPLHVLSEGAILVRYNSGTNTITLLVTTNSASLPGVLPPYSVGALWLNGQFSHLSNIVQAGSGISISATDSNLTLSSSGAGSALSFNGTTVTNANITNSHAIRWEGSSSNYQAYITNYFYWEGIPIQFPNVRDGVYIYWSQSGSNLTPIVAANSLDPTRWEEVPQGEFPIRVSAGVGDLEYGYIGSNLNLNPVTGELSATVPAGTNSWQIGVNGVLVTEPNLTNSTEILPSATGSNVIFTIATESVTTNKINTTFQSLLLNQYRINNLTNWFLSLTNNNSSDAGRVVWYTNSIGDYVAYATNLPAGGGSGAGTNAFVNGLLYQPFRLTNNFTDTGRVIWRTNSDGDILAYATNLPAGGIGSGTNAFVNGVLQQPMRHTNSTDISWGDLGGSNWGLSINDSAFYSRFTNTLVASNNVSIAYDGSAHKVMISAITSGGTGTAVTVDGGSDLTRANLADASTTFLFDINTTNVTGRLPDRDFGAITVSSSGAAMDLDDGTVTSNKVVAANITIDKLSASGTPLSTNFLAGDYAWKQITTNMIPGLVADILSAATNGPTGGGGGAGTNLVLNGVLMQPAIITNSTTLIWTTNASGHISGTVTNVPGSTTDNMVQLIGSAYFIITNNSTIGDFSNLSISGVITNATVVGTGENDAPIEIEFSFPTRSTNYLWALMPEGNVNGFIAYEAEGYRTTSSFRIKIHEGVGSTFFTGGYWMRFSMYDTASVGGNGGDVISTANNNFTQTNNFSGPVNAATVTVNDNAYGAGWNGSTNVVTENAVYDKIETLQPLNTNLTQIATAITTVGQVHIRDATGVITNISTTGSGTVMRTRTGVVRYLSIPAASFGPEATEPATAATNLWLTATDRSAIECWEFSATTTNGVQTTFPMPETWGLGTLNVRIHWKQVTAEANTTNVWSVAIGALGDGETGGGNIGTAVTVLDQGLNNTNQVAKTSWSSAITAGGTPAAGDLLSLSIRRHPGNSSDNMSVATRLLGVLLEFTESATEPTDN